MSNITKF